MDLTRPDGDRVATAVGWRERLALWQLRLPRETRDSLLLLAVTALLPAGAAATTAATVTAESLIRARLMTSKRGDYANPLNKTYKGIVSPWAP